MKIIKQWSLALICIFLLTACGANSKENDNLNAYNVKNLMTQSQLRMNGFNGVVVAQQSKEIKKDANKVIKDILVKQGDEVKADTVLFNYDVEQMNVEKQKAALEIERMNNEIINNQNQINNLVNEQASVDASQKFALSLEIQSLQTQIQETQYNIKAKQVELDQITKSLENSNVVAGIAGIVQSIALDGVDQMGNALPLMTILQTGNYRIKGNVNEMNMGEVQPGTSVIIRSRVNKDKTWLGTVDSIEMNNPSQDGNMAGMPSDEMAQSSSYPFFIQLENTDGLFLGQHVYIEINQGQTEVKEGVWILSNFVEFDDEGQSFVYKVNSNQHLEKTQINLGELDATGNLIQVLDGLTEEDYICEITENTKEGLKVNLVEGESNDQTQ